MINKPFLSKLIRKLSTGSARSLHLNAVADKKTNVDLFELSNLATSLHLKLLKLLLTKQNFAINLQGNLDALSSKSEEEAALIKRLFKKLDHLYIQNQNEISEFGTNSFALGFPTLILKDPIKPDRIIKAPIFIWYLDFEKDLRKTQTWNISRKEDNPVIFNELLRNYLAQHFQLNISLPESFDEDNFIDEHELLTFCDTVLSSFQIDQDDYDREIKILPTTNEFTIDPVTKHKPWLRWSGILGLFRSPKESIIADLRHLQERGLEEMHDITLPLDLRHSSLVTLDPSQERILNLLPKNNNIIIQGPPGTGKSQSLTAIIASALLNEQRCLIVCEKRTAMKVIQDNLRAIGLADLSVIVDDIYRDRNKVVHKIREALEKKNQGGEASSTYVHDTTCDNIDRTKSIIQDYFSNAATRIFGDDYFYDIVGKYLSSKTEHSKIKIDTNTWNLDYGTYITFRSEIKKVIHKTDFKNLHGDVFAILNDVCIHQQSAKEIIEQIESFFSMTEQMLAEYEIGRNANEKLFLPLTKKSSQKLRFRAFFGGVNRLAYNSKLSFIARYETLTKAKVTNFFDLNLMPLSNVESLDTVIDNIVTLNEHSQQLKNKSAQLPYYIEWRQSLDELSVITQEFLLSVSHHYPNADWSKIGSSWYYSEILERHIETHSLDQDIVDAYLSLLADELTLKEKQAEAICNMWTNQQNTLFKNRTIAEIKTKFNLRKNKVYQSKTSLRYLFEQDAELISACFPVLFMNPTTCSASLPLMKNIFDYVIFDEASQLRLEDTFTAQLRGKKVIVSGDMHQMPPSNYFQSEVYIPQSEGEFDLDEYYASSASLLDYVNDIDHENSWLNFHYRSKHPDLIAFSNAAFYGGQLIALPERVPGPAITFHAIDGLYKNRTNEDEASAIVNYLFDRDTTNIEQAPSIGIATFNSSQRDLIWERIIESADEDTDKEQILAGLVSAGLFVKNLENIQGEERDIMIISTTFGRNIDGGFKQFFGTLNQEKGYQLLNVLITRAKEKMIIYSSVPQEYINQYHEEIEIKGNIGKGIFYAYLAFAQAISANNITKSESILALLRMKCLTKKSNIKTSGDFALRDLIVDQLNKMNLAYEIAVDHALGGYVLPICLLKDNKVIKVIEFEKNLRHYQDEAYRSILHRNEILASFDISTHFIWSAKWYLNYSAEVVSLKNFVEN